MPNPFNLRGTFFGCREAARRMLAETPGVQERRQAAGLGDDIVTALEDKVIVTIPLGRSAQPDDIARVALFCASDLAAFVTGTTVFADGGHSAF